jgi:uncharacterized LabA/DUF88 family protein
MARTAVFVDAGYLFAHGSDALTGRTQQRHRLVLDEPAVVTALTAFAEDQSAAPRSLLRIYWYDATSSQGPNADHIRLAETDNVKLRLGIVNSFGKQKGVDSLIIADLIELARNGAIDSAVLMAGDDDLRVGVQVAQTFGVRVHLLGISGSRGDAQSKLLVREADTSSRWNRDVVATFLSLRDTATTQEVAIPETATAAPPQLPPVLTETGSTDGMPPAAIDIENSLRSTSVRFLESLQRVDFVDIETVYDAERKVPYQYDKRLLATARTELGRDLDIVESRLLRSVFIVELKRRLANPVDDAG